jgi:hypothetical protein
MRSRHWAALIVCTAMTAVVVWRGREVEPPSAIETAAAASDEAATVDSNEVARLREETRELARLRNEVGQLRTRRSELDAARQEQVRLIAARQHETVTPRESPSGFVSKDKLANVGFATPEDAVQTFFWAMREGSLRMVMQSISPNDKERQRFEKMPPEQLAKMEQKGGRMGDELKNFTEFGVRSREVISDDAVVLHIGPSFNTNTLKFRLERTIEGWKLRDPLSGF